MSAWQRLTELYNEIDNLMPQVKYELAVWRDDLLSSEEQVAILNAYSWYEERGGNVEEWYDGKL